MRAMDCKVASPHGGATELMRGSVECVRPAMETGKVEGTSDVTIINGETKTCWTRHEGTSSATIQGTTEKFTETQRETQETKKGTPETREMEQVE